MSLIIENGNCLELMKELPDKSIDLFICDLPYGETNCKWDSKIDLEQFWEQFRRLRKSTRTACIHFCSTKFGYTLIKSWEKGYKMDMVWKKRNKTGGLQSRNRPMRNHEMVYFFYDQAPKYNRDTYHKRIVAVPKIVKEKPASVVEEKGYEYNGKKFVKDNNYSYGYKELNGSNFGTYGFEPPNPASVVEEKDTIYSKNTIGWSSSENNKTYLKENPGYTPRQPGSVVEEKDPRVNEKGISAHGWNISHMDKPRVAHFDPKLPVSVVEENAESNKVWGYDKPNTFTSCPISKDGTNQNFKPKLPASVVEDLVEPAEDEPWSMFESTKVFIGKRHHQTEKPQDILEFFIKYWTDEGDTILDPTMGSGSTGVACNKLKRNFIGFELDETIFKVAEKRVNIT